MINGAHVILYSTDPEADRGFLRDVLGLPNVDIGHGWLIFGLPPSEVAVHPADTGGTHELYFLCDDVDTLITNLRARGVICGDVQDQPWGRLTAITLPGGGEVGAYEPKHERPSNPA